MTNKEKAQQLLKALEELGVSMEDLRELLEPKKERPLVNGWHKAFKGAGWVIQPPDSLGKMIAYGRFKDGNVFYYEQQAISALAAAQLSHIVADANGDWEPDWQDPEQERWIIGFDPEGHELIIEGAHGYSCYKAHLPVKSLSIAEAMVEHPEIRILWEKFWMV